MPFEQKAMSRIRIKNMSRVSVFTSVTRMRLNMRLSPMIERVVGASPRRPLGDSPGVYLAR